MNPIQPSQTTSADRHNDNVFFSDEKAASASLYAERYFWEIGRVRFFLFLAGLIKEIDLFRALSPNCIDRNQTCLKRIVEDFYEQYNLLLQGLNGSDGTTTFLLAAVDENGNLYIGGLGQVSGYEPVALLLASNRQTYQKIHFEVSSWTVKGPYRFNDFCGLFVSTASLCNHSGPGPQLWKNVCRLVVNSLHVKNIGEYVMEAVNRVSNQPKAAYFVPFGNVASASHTRESQDRQSESFVPLSGINFSAVFNAVTNVISRIKVPSNNTTQRQSTESGGFPNRGALSANTEEQVVDAPPKHLIVVQPPLINSVPEHPVSTLPSESSQENTSLECAICYENFIMRKPTSLSCGHVYCLECIDAHLESGKGNCPTCRKPCSKQDLRTLFLN